MYDYTIGKARLRRVLNMGICDGKTSEQTAHEMGVEFANVCTECIFANAGRVPCDKHKCFIETALERYKAIANQKCVKEEIK